MAKILGVGIEAIHPSTFGYYMIRLLLESPRDQVTYLDRVLKSAKIASAYFAPYIYR